MEEIKQEEQVVEEVQTQQKVEQPDFSAFNEAISKLQKENEAMKAEIIKLKNREVSINPPQEEKKYVVNKEEWKDF